MYVYIQKCNVCVHVQRARDKKQVDELTPRDDAHMYTCTHTHTQTLSHTHTHAHPSVSTYTHPPKNALTTLISAEVHPMCSKIPENLPPSTNNHEPSPPQTLYEGILKVFFLNPFTVSIG